MSNFSKQETVAFEQVLEGFEDAIAISNTQDVTVINNRCLDSSPSRIVNDKATNTNLLIDKNINLCSLTIKSSAKYLLFDKLFIQTHAHA